MEPFYRATFSRALWSYVNSGFFARDLDADDHAFLEYVKVSGSANGSLPSAGVVLVEELEFWHLPYSIAPNVERSIGKRPRAAESEAQRAVREARQKAREAQRIIRANEKAIADAELEREHREWKLAQHKREVRELISDAEWEAAAPCNNRKFGATIGRHYVPQWKLDELKIEVSSKPVDLKKLSAVKLKKYLARIEAAKKLDERRTQKQMDERQRDRKWRAEQAAKAAERKRLRKERIIAEARKTVEETKQLVRSWEDSAGVRRYPTVDVLKRAIVILFAGTPGQVWNRMAMMRALGCERDMLDKALDELLRDRSIKQVGSERVQ